jgi:hypothetical protein
VVSFDRSDAGVFVDHMRLDLPPHVLVLRPGSLVAGMGCNRGTDAKRCAICWWNTFAKNRLAISSLRAIATVDLKADEPGMLALAESLNIPMTVFTRDRLKTVEQVPTPSAMVEKHIGVKSVCEAAASAGDPPGTTDRSQTEDGQRHPGSGRRRLYIVGIGPGGPEHLSQRAVRVLETVDAVAGYTTYIDLIRPLDRGQTDRQHGHEKRGRPGVCGPGPGPVGHHLRRGFQRGPGGLRHGRSGAGNVPGTGHCHRQ